MKKNITWVITAVVLVGVIVIASVLYDDFRKDYAGDALLTEGVENTREEEDGKEGDVSSESEYQKAPDFTVVNEKGEEVSLSDYKGKPVVVNFWATWCYYCEVEMPDFQTAYEKYPEVQFLMVNVTDGVRETVDIASEFIEDEGYTFPVFYDTMADGVRTYGISSYPTTFFINAEGEFVAGRSGMLDLAILEQGISLITNP